MNSFLRMLAGVSPLFAMSYTHTIDVPARFVEYTTRTQLSRDRQLGERTVPNDTCLPSHDSNETNLVLPTYGFVPAAHHGSVARTMNASMAPRAMPRS